MKKTRLWIILAVLAGASLACNAIMGGGKTPTPDGGPAPVDSPTATRDSGSGSGNDIDSEYPLPANVSVFTAPSEGSVNFQTTLSLKDVLAFYRDEFGKQGYKEREILTVSSDATFSIVFDGHASGKAIVVQGVDLGGGSTNVNIRLEAID